MSMRSVTAVLACAIAGTLPAVASAASSVGTQEQISWVRRAATRFVTAELTDNGGEACAVLTAQQRVTRHNRTCEERWKAKSAKMLRQAGTRRRLRAERHAIATAAVIVHGNDATIELPEPLLNGSNHLLWTENCWMLTG